MSTAPTSHEPSRPFDRVVHASRLAFKRLKYGQRKRQHLKIYQPDADRAPDRQLLETFANDGVAVVRQFLPASVREEITAELRDAIEALSEDRYTGELRTLAEREGGLFRIFDIEESLSPASRAFFDNPFIHDFANSLSRSGMRRINGYVDYKTGVGREDPNRIYHIDNWRLRFKTFLLLQDVSEDQAPFVYVKGSHREAKWRHRWDWGYHAKGIEHSHLTSDDVAEISAKYGYEECTYTGRAGDLILADTRGIHRGTVLRQGTRLQLVQLFVMKGER